MKLSILEKARQTVYRLVAFTTLSLAAANVTAIPFTYTNNSEALLETQNVSSINQLLTFDLTNNTGQAWDGFSFRAAGSKQFGSYDFMRLTNYIGSGSASFADLDGDSIGYNESLSISSINIAAGGLLSFSVNVFGGVAPEGMTSFSLFGTPTAIDNGNPPDPGDNDDPVVPVSEPGLISLLALGLAGLVFTRRRRSVL